MMNEQINVNENKKEQENNSHREELYKTNTYHPFWSLFNDCFGDETSDVMRTDITDSGDSYQVEIEVPGMDKKDVKISLDKGYLTINAKVNASENVRSGKNLHRERFYGSYRRSYYVGDAINKEDISAAMDKGILTITIAKPKEKSDDEKYIDIL